jgi:uncharacterized protein
MELRDSSVLLTGATGGIGQAIAHTLHSRGAKLILTGRREDVLSELAGEVDGTPVVADLAQRADVDRLATEHADVDILIANAAVGGTGHAVDLDAAAIDTALDVNLRAPIVLAQALGTAMAKRGRGQIVLVSSLSGIAGSPRSSLYNATKFGLRGFGQGLRSDLRGHGVGVSVVFPGFVSDAGMFANAGVKLPAFVGTSTPQQVADGVVSAIERNRGEVVVAPLTLKIGTKIASLVPDLAAGLQRRAGSERIADDMTEGQKGWSG